MDINKKHIVDAQGNPKEVIIPVVKGEGDVVSQ
jgi:hypothetical protein